VRRRGKDYNRKMGKGYNVDNAAFERSELPSQHFGKKSKLGRGEGKRVPVTRLAKKGKQRIRFLQEGGRRGESCNRGQGEVWHVAGIQRKKKKKCLNAGARGGVTG